MYVRFFLTLFSIIGIAVAAGSVNAEARRMDRREHKQSSRIKQGVKSGAMTRGEARKAVRQQNRIHRAEKKAKADGTVTKKEKRKISRMQNKASSDLYRMKHNDRTHDKAAEEADLPKPVVEE